MATEIALPTRESYQIINRISFLHYFILIICVVIISGCATHSYDSSEQFSKHDISFPAGRIELNLGIEVRDTLPREVHEATKDDISDGTAEWITSELSEKFSRVTDLNLYPERRHKVDMVLEVDIQDIRVDAPGVSGLSTGLAVFYGVAPVFEHYAVEKTVLSYGVVGFRLLNPSNSSSVWEYTVRDKAKDEVQLASKNQLVFSVIANAIEHFIYSSEFLTLAKNIEQHGLPSSPGTTPKQQEAQLTSTSKGSGWLLDSRHVITNYHVIEDGTVIAVRPRGGVPIGATVVMSDNVNDLVLLELSEEIEHAKGIRLASEPPHTGDRVFVLGYPLSGLMGKSVKITEGIVNSTTGADNDPRMFQISAGMQKGNSGGPVVNEYGEVVGVATASLNSLYALKVTGALPQNVNYAVKSQYLQTLVMSADVKIGPIHSPHGEPMSARNIADTLSKSVVRVESIKW